MSPRIFFGGIVVGIMLVAGGFLLLREGEVNTDDHQASVTCNEVCQKASQACPSLIDFNKCTGTCISLDEETIKHLQESTSCEQITSKPELIADLIIPEVATPNPVDVGANECEAACGNYVGKCLALVPNATPALFEEGQSSCEAECAGWSGDKIECMTTALDCEAMTTVCGL